MGGVGGVSFSAEKIVNRYGFSATYAAATTASAAAPIESDLKFKRMVKS